MKIYNEVTIDMNPESITYGKHTSENSYEYKGNVDLCCGGTAKLRLKDTGLGGQEKGSLGYQAWGLGAGHGTSDVNPFGGTRMVHPETLPGFFDSEAGRLSGVEAIGGRDVGSTIAPFNPVQAATTGGSKSFLGIGVGSRATPQGNLAAEAQRYGSQFKGRYYDPYIQTAITDPAKEALQAYTMTAQEKFGSAMPQGIMEGYTGPKGQFGYNNQIIVGGQTAGPAAADARTALEVGAAGYEADMRMAAMDRASIGRQEAELEEDLITAEEDKEAGLEQAQLNRETARKKIATARAGELPTGFGVQKAYAPMAKSGFAASGPIQAQIAAGEEKTIDKLRQSAVAGRLDERKYQDTIARLEEGFLDKQKATERGREGFAEQRAMLAEKEKGYRQAFDATKREYGQDLRSLADQASSELTDVGTWIQGLTKGHEAFGRALESKSELPGISYGYKLRSQGLKDTVGTTAYNAPGGGWFSESQTHGGISGAIQDLDAARSFGDYLGKQTVDQILGAEFGEDWKGKDPSQLGIGEGGEGE